MIKNPWISKKLSKQNRMENIHFGTHSGSISWWLAMRMRCGVRPDLAVKGQGSSVVGLLCTVGRVCPQLRAIIRILQQQNRRGDNIDS